MATEQKKIQQLIFEEVYFFFEPLIRTGGDPQIVDEYLQAQGLNMGALFNGSNSSAFYTQIQTIITSCEVLEDLIQNPPDHLGEISEAILSLGELMTAVRDLTQSLPGAVQGLDTFAAELFQRLFTSYISRRSGKAYTFLRMFNIIDFETQRSPVIGGGGIVVDHRMVPIFKGQKLLNYLTDPIETFQDEFFGAGFADLDHVNQIALLIFPKLQRLLEELGMDVNIGHKSRLRNLSALENRRMEGMMTSRYIFQDAASGLSAEAGLTMGLIPVNEGGPGAYVVPFGSVGFTKGDDEWQITSEVSGQVEGFELTGNGVDIYGNGVSSYGFDLSLIRVEDQPLVFGDPTGTRLEINRLGFAAGIHLNGREKELFVKTILEDCRLVISAGEGDSFLQNILAGNEIEAKFGIVVGVNNITGLFFEGGSGLEILIPLHLQLGPVEITDVLIVVKPTDSDIPFELSTNVKATLGPLVVVVENIGLRFTFSFPKDGSGNLGPFDLAFGIKPPNGVGISVDAGIIVGGGYLYLNFERGEYAGALQLSIKNFLSLTAIGLINTRMPNGSEGFSLLIIVTAQFMPAFQLGYGFTLNGVGGLLGLNREVLLDPLRDGVRTGAINGIMFPTDVVANAPRIISDLQTIFPIKEGSFLVGPMAMIGWGTPTLITLSLGVIIQLPDPKIAILGVLKMVLPTEDLPILKLQVNFLGTLDPANQLITFDASLFDSNLLQVFTLTGDMAVRLRWGSKPDFILSAGGFHPSFEPTMTMPSLQRLGIRILDTDAARIQVQAYFALTSNSVQFGARADCYFGLDGFSVEGFLGFDALMMFSPFEFSAVAAGGFTLDTVFGDASIRIRAKLEGPAPWSVDATGKVEVFGFDFEADYKTEWGQSRAEAQQEIALKPLLLSEFNKSEVWSGGVRSGKPQMIAISNPSEEDVAEQTLIYPDGMLVIAQKLVPFGIILKKLGNRRITDIREVVISGVKLGASNGLTEQVSDSFAMGQYVDLSSAEKLSSPSFEMMDCGVAVGFSQNNFDFKMGTTIRRSQEYEQIFIDKEKKKKTATYKSGSFNDLIKGSASYNTRISDRYMGLKGIPVTKYVPLGTEYKVVKVTDNSMFSTEEVFGSHMEATQYVNRVCNGNDALKGNLTIIEK